MSPHTRALLQIHLCVMLWGFTAILGKLITLSALPIVWWRMILVAGALLLVPRFWSGLRVLPLRLVTIYAAIGVLVSLHWLTFYGSIKLANASVTATCMALVPVFVAFVEPVIAKRRFDPAEVFFGIAVVPGVAMVVGGTPSGMRLGIAVGALSAFLAAIFASLNKRFIGNSQALTVTGIEMGAGAVFLSIVGLILPTAMFALPSPRDAWLLAALATACTLFPFALSLVALRRLSAFSASLVVNLEPIYAILLAIVLLGEQRELSSIFYFGVAIILIIAFSHPLWTARMRIRTPADA